MDPKSLRNATLAIIMGGGAGTRLFPLTQKRTEQRLLPASKVSGTQIQRAIITDGCVITDAHVDRAVIGIRSVIGSGTTIRNSILMGADYYRAEAWQKPGTPPLGIGRHCRIEGRHYRQECALS